jgi:hypothetical protein
MLCRQKYHHSIQRVEISWFLTIDLVDVNIIAIYGFWKSSEIVYYQITQLSEQQCRLAVPLAKHNVAVGGLIWTYLLCNSLVRITIENTI